MQVGLRREAEAGCIQQPDIAVDDRNAVREAADRLMRPGIAFGAAEPQPGGDVQGQEMPAMRPAATARPAMRFDHFQYVDVFDDSLDERAFEPTVELGRA